MKITLKVSIILLAAALATSVWKGNAQTIDDEIQVGDRLRITAAEELVVHVAGEGEPTSDGGAQVVIRLTEAVAIAVSKP